MSWYSKFLIIVTVVAICLFAIDVLSSVNDVANPIVVVHVDSAWEGAERVAEAVNQMAVGYNTVYLLAVDENWRETTLVDFEPTKVVIAPGGEWQGVKTYVAVMVGGYTRACFKNAASAMVQQNKEVLLALPMECVYHNSKETLDEYYQSNWGQDPEGFLDYMHTCALEFGFENPVVEISLRTIWIEEKVGGG